MRQRPSSCRMVELVPHKHCLGGVPELDPHTGQRHRACCLLSRTLFSLPETDRELVFIPGQSPALRDCQCEPWGQGGWGSRRWVTICSPHRPGSLSAEPGPPSTARRGRCPSCGLGQRWRGSALSSFWEVALFAGASGLGAVLRRGSGSSRRHRSTKVGDGGELTNSQTAARRNQCCPLRMGGGVYF